MPKVSVILSSYNQAEYLAHSIESVLGQTFRDWELLVIDNGSTDSSRSILERYADRPGVRVILCDRNEAPSKRLNQAIAAAQGDYISLLYSDDYYLPHKLERQVGLFAGASDRVGVVYSPGMRLNVSTGQIWQDPSASVSGDVLRPLLEVICRGGFVNPISPLIKRRCFVEYPFHEDIFIEGEAIMLRFAMRNQFLYDSDPTAVMRDHDRNIGRSVKNNSSYFLASLAKLGRHPHFPADCRPALQSLEQRVYLAAGWQGVRVVDDVGWAREMFFRLIELDGKSALHPKVIAGLALSYLPSTARRWVNNALFALHRTAGHRNYVPDSVRVSDEVRQQD